MKEYVGKCQSCGATLTLDRPDAFVSPSGAVETDLPPAEVMEDMRAFFERTDCPSCGQRTLRLISPV